MDPGQAVRRSLSIGPVDVQGALTPDWARYHGDLLATPTRWARRAAVAAASPQNEQVSARRRARPTKSLLKKLKVQRENFARQRRCELCKVPPSSVLESTRRKPQSIPEFLEIKGMGKKRSEQFGKAPLNVVLLHEPHEARHQDVVNRGQPGSADSDAVSNESSEERQNHSSRGELTNAAPRTPIVRRPPQLHTVLTWVLQRTMFLRERVSRDEPIELDVSDGNLPVARDITGLCNAI